jgi:hypothetical protein
MKLAWPFGGRRKLSAFFDAFSSNQLPGILAGIGQPPVAKAEEFGAGRNALVRRLVLADGRSLILRAYLADPDKQPTASYGYLNRRLAERGFRMPTVHFRGLFPFPRGRTDVELLIEDFIQGRTLADSERDNSGIRHQAVKALLDLHSDQSPRPGRPWLGKEGPDPIHAAIEKTPRRLDRVRQELPDVAPRQLQTCLAWLRERVAQRPLPSSYELIHDDFNRENLLLMPDGEIVVIDLVTMAYGCFESDLVGARWMFFGEPWWREFCNEYFAAEPLRRERFEQTTPLFSAFFHLTKAARQASSARKSIEKGRSDAAEAHRAKCRFHWEQLMLTIEGCAADQSESPAPGNST